MLDKILVVEDSAMMRRLYRSVLESRARSLIFAETGAEGLDQAARAPDVSLVLVDINMPEMDGIEFLRRLRSELGYREVPAVVISTEDAEADRRMALDAGADAFLPKPWTPETLLETIGKVTDTEADR